MLLRRSLKATLISIPALILLFVLLFPPSSMHEFEEMMGWMMLATFFLGVPLFIAILLFNAIFNRVPEPVAGPASERSRVAAKSRSWRPVLIGAVIAGFGAAFIHGIILEVWWIFTGIGGLLGFIAGKIRS